MRKTFHDTNFFQDILAGKKLSANKSLTPIQKEQRTCDVPSQVAALWLAYCQNGNYKTHTYIRPVCKHTLKVTCRVKNKSYCFVFRVILLFLHCLYPYRKPRWAEVGQTYILAKAFLYALVLTCRNLAVHDNLSKTRQCRTLHGGVLYTTLIGFNRSIGCFQ